MPARILAARAAFDAGSTKGILSMPGPEPSRKPLPAAPAPARARPTGPRRSVEPGNRNPAARLDPRMLGQLQRLAGNAAVAAALAPAAAPARPQPPRAKMFKAAPPPPRPSSYVGWTVQRAPAPTKFGRMAFAPSDLVADGTSTSTASVRTTPAGRAVTWSLEGAAHGSAIDAAGVITAGPSIPAGSKSVPLTSKATDAADAARSKTGSIPLWDKNYKQALADFPVFVSTPYSLPNYTIGVNGKFDAVYRPKAKQLKVTVKVAFKFNGTWSKKQKDNYRNGYMWTIRNAWSNRYTFVNKRDPQDVWGKLGPVGVDLRVQEVAVGAQHFLVNVSKTAGTSQVAGGVTDLFKGDLSSQPAFNPKTGKGELARLDRITPTPIVFPAGSSAIPAADAPKLDFLATYMKRIHNPVFTLTMAGHANEQPTKKANSTLAGQRAAAVRAALVAGGATNHKLLMVNRGQTGAPAGDPTWQKVVITSRLPAGWENKQAVAVHEFGHMIGLGDEYGGSPANPLATHHGLTKAALGQQYADQVAKRGDTDYASIMEGGDDVRIQHYVTFWSALCDASATATVPATKFGQADWKFVG